MEPHELSNEDLLLAAERDAAGEPNELRWNAEFLARCRGMRLKKAAEEGKVAEYWPKMKPEDLDAAMKKGYERRYPNMLFAFSQGELFGCQAFDFTSMLMATEAEVEQDLQTWNVFETLAQALNVRGEKNYQGVRAFAESRVFMPYKNRRRYFYDGNSTAIRPLATLTKEQQDAHERQRQAFDALRHTWRWWWATSSVPERAKLKEEYAALG